jgi:hypothetical protein
MEGFNSKEAGTRHGTTRPPPGDCSVFVVFAALRPALGFIFSRVPGDQLTYSDYGKTKEK